MPSFSKNLGPVKVKSIKANIDCITHGLSDDSSFSDFTSIKKLNDNGLSFLTDSELLNYNNDRNGTFICSESTYKKLKGTNPIIEVKNVNFAVAVISNLFNRSFNDVEILSLDKPDIGDNCIISNTAIIGKGCVIGNNVKISAGCNIGYNCIIGDNTTIDCNTIISNSIIAENVSIGRNVSIGQNGFGFAINKNENIKIYHNGKVILQNGVCIGSNCTIDRGSFGDTIIGENSYFDNLCHIAHNVVVGNNCVFAAMSGIAGSTNIGNNVLAGGQTGIAGHLNIGSNVKIAAQSGVLKDVDDNSTVMGHPAINKFTFLKRFKNNNA